MQAPSLHEARATLDNFKDPFNKDCVKSIGTYCYQSFNGWTYTGNVKFKNGDTEGEQKFSGISLSDVLTKMERFVESL